MLRVQVGFGAVRAGELPVGVLLRNLSLGSASSGSGRRRASRSTGKHTSPSLRADHMSRLFALRGHHGRLWHEGALSVGRVHARLGHLAGSGHRPKHRWHTPARRRRRRNGLGMNGRSRGLGHHGRRGRVLLLLLLLVRVVRHHLVATTAGILAGGRGRVRGHVVRSTWGVWSCWSSWAVLITSVPVLHNRVARLKRRELMLELVRRDRRS